MKVLIISDMEGVAGICRWEQVSAGRSGYEEGRRLYTEELNATVRGAFAGGASEVVVMDCHGAGGDWSFNSLIPDALDARCEFVVQHALDRVHRDARDRAATSPCSSASTPARAPSAACSRTRSARPSWRNLRFNGTTVGEVGINAALCGTWGVPVALVTGDDVVCEESTELLGPQPQDARRQARPRAASAPATSPPPRPASCSRHAARDALRDVASAPVYDPGAPCTIEVELATSDHADVYRHRPGVTLTDPRTIEITAPTWWDAWRAVYL